MRVLLVAPHLNIKENVNIETFPPLGIMSLSSFLKERKINTKMLDCTMSRNPLLLVEKFVKKFRPTVVGISCIIASYRSTVEIAKKVKGIDKQIKVVVGGIYPTFACEKILRIHKEIDFVVRGEGEHTLYELLMALSNEKNLENVDGISFIKDKKYIRTDDRKLISNLNELPLPDYKSLATMKQYQRKGKILIVSSRGCPYVCTFCSTSNYWSHKWRAINARKTVGIVKLLVKRYKAKNILFGDDLFILDENRVKDICKEIIKAKLKFRWRCSVRANLITPDLVKWLKKAGCDSVFLGAESGDQITLNRIDKRQTLKQIADAVKICHMANVDVVASFIMGFPWEDRKSIEKSIAFAKRIKAEQAIWFLFHPDIGSPIFNELGTFGVDKDLSNPDDCITVGKSFMNTHYLKAYELEELYLKAILDTNNQ